MLLRFDVYIAIVMLHMPHFTPLILQASVALKACNAWFHAAVAAQVVSFNFRALLSVLSPSPQVSLPKGAPPPILDTSSSLLLFSAAINIAGVRGDACSAQQQSSSDSNTVAPAHMNAESLSVLIGRVSALLELQQLSLSRGGASSSAANDTAAASGLEAALIISFKSLNDCEREKTVSELNHSMVFVLLQAAGCAHGVLLLQRFALMSLAGISMSSSGRRMLLNEATPPVPPLMDVLTGGELHSAALAALVLGNLALEPVALAALDRCAAVFAREVVSLMSCEQVVVLRTCWREYCLSSDPRMLQTDFVRFAVGAVRNVAVSSVIRFTFRFGLVNFIWFRFNAAFILKIIHA